MATFSFRPSARLQRYLGRELIADPNLAVIEFVKNAYDANARNVFLTFSFPGDGTSSLTIADDGDGMSETSFERNWMHPGYSEKADELVLATPRTETGRVPVGEKGLGRLAAGRLGASLEVFTRTATNQPWLHVLFNWAEFDDMSKLMDQVKIAYDHEKKPADPSVQSGTILVINDLELNWDGRVRGRPLPGRSRTRLGRLKQDLQLLVRPLQATDTDFTIHLDSDSFLDPNDIGDITPSEAVDEADYVYDFEFRSGRGGQGTIRRRLRRGPGVRDLGGDADEAFPPVTIRDVAADEGRPANLECGPFRGRFMYTPPPAAKRAKEIDAVGSGVLLYRDGVMVEPYGLDGNDWIGVSARKAQRQGYALIQPSVFSGFVLISRLDNPALRDQSNRQGLLESEISEAFVQHVQAEFSVFERLVAPELKRRWESIESKAAKQAAEAIDLAAIRMRAIAHSLGQPLLGLDADIHGVRLVAQHPDVPAHISRDLVELADSAAGHLQTAQAAIARFRDVPIAERTLVSARTLISQAVAGIRPLARSLDVRLHVERMPDRELLVHRELLAEAIAELVRNAVEAPRGDDGQKEVRLSWHELDGDFVLEITDDGAGIAGVSSGGSIAGVESTKGRPGMGLSSVAEIVTASLGRVRVASTGTTGTSIEVALPDRLAGLRSDGWS